MHKRQITVAVVDDDPNILGSVQELLNAEGFITELFASAEGFLASGVIPRVDCLLLDIQLAGASGIDLRHHLEACGSKLPAIFMTGLDDEALHRQALNAGCVALLHKPFLEHQLIDAIEKAVPLESHFPKVKCPWDCVAQMSAFGGKADTRLRFGMSAYDPKRT